ncbi:MAG: tetratricopeptide repeat protein [Nitrospiria bacterium]
MKWIVFYFLMILTGNPLLVLILFLLFYGILDRQYFGFFPRLTRFFRRGQEIRRLIQTLSLNPNDMPAQLALGRAYVLNGQPVKAVPHLETAFPRMKESPEVHYYLGLAYLKTGREAEGQEAVLKTIEMDHRFQYGEPYLRLGEYYFSAREHTKALEMLETFCSIHTSSSEGYYYLGSVQMALGNKGEAERSFRKAIEVYKISPRYKKQLDRKWIWKARRVLATL